MTNAIISHSDTQTLYGASQALPLIVIDSDKCYGVISLYGGQILEFRPKDKAPLLWLSPLAVFETGKAIRGGVPICAPWFGPYRGKAQSGTSYPNHGFARTSTWQQQDSSINSNNEVQVALTLAPSETSLALYPHPFTLEIQFILGDELTIEFSVINHSDTVIECEWALHSYFAVEDIALTEVNGLDALQYVDSANNGVIEHLNGSLSFNGEVDRYFINGSAEQTINSKSPITISGNNCDSVITWNPGAALADKMSDISAAYHHQFVCVERGAIFSNQWQIAPSQKQSATMTLSN